MLAQDGATRAEAKGPVERLHERIVAGDRGWFFAQIADRVAERRTAKGLSQRELAELVRDDAVGNRAPRARRPAAADRHAAPHRRGARLRPRASSSRRASNRLLLSGRVPDRVRSSATRSRPDRRSGIRTRPFARGSRRPTSGASGSGGRRRRTRGSSSGRPRSTASARIRSRAGSTSSSPAPTSSSSRAGSTTSCSGARSRRPPRNLEAMLERGRAAGLAVAVADVLPWNNGDERTAADNPASQRADSGR